MQTNTINPPDRENKENDPGMKTTVRWFGVKKEMNATGQHGLDASTSVVGLDGRGLIRLPKGILVALLVDEVDGVHRAVVHFVQRLHVRGAGNRGL